MAHGNGSLTVPDEFPGKRIRSTDRLYKQLFFGDPGSGKTTLLATYAQDERTAPVLLLDPTGGSVGVVEAMEAAGSAVYSVGDDKELLRYGANLLAVKHDYRTLAVDDFTDIFGRTKVAVAQAAQGPDAEVFQWQDYDKVYERMRKVLRMFKTLASPVAHGGAGMHVVVTTWVTEHEDAFGRKRLVPKLAGGFSFEVPGYFDQVGFMEARGIREATETEVTYAFQNKLTCQTDGKLVVRDRFGRLGTVYSPTATTIFDTLGVPNSDAISLVERV